jgi:hypothetical protein
LTLTWNEVTAVAVAGSASSRTAVLEGPVLLHPAVASASTAHAVPQPHHRNLHMTITPPSAED